jgi:3',5'-cyclic AMP phosphodiesterase CpdA
MRTLVHISDIHFGREIPAVADALIADILSARPDVC